MQSTFRKRLVILVLSVLVMLALFFVSVRRASEDVLPPTPTCQSGVASGQTANTQTAGAETTAVVENVLRTATPIQLTPSPMITNLAPAETANKVDSQATAQSGMYKATQRARAMSNIIKVLYGDESVSILDGYYKQLDDFSVSFNKPGYYRISFSDFQAKYFVLRANVLWDNAGEEISYPTAGCGFIFGYQETLNQNRIVLTLDGNVRIQNISGGDTTQPDPDYYGELDKPAGHANLILAVDQGWITVYVNNQLISRVYDADLREGWIGYAVEAGSSYDYGTQCEFKDIELWQIE
ncbi:MAG: hypothetical protein LLG42_03915 [Chloroflexi bacterium]|nr:hypothetical protein [Chloroflexota bacterium]